MMFEDIRDDITKLKEYKIGVISGGISNERDISLKSGRAVFSALLKGGLDVEFIDLTEYNRLSFMDEHEIDIAFIALHGKHGEDGEVQEYFESRGIMYTGSGPTASRKALDKLESKKIFSAAGLYVPGHISIKEISQLGNLEFRLPCVVKPRYEGSSLGLSIVKEEGCLRTAVVEALKFDQDVIVEDFIPGKEVTVGVLDGKPLPVIEIKTTEGVYDYDSKYLSINTEYFVPATLDEAVYVSCQDAGLKAHNALGCHGFSRTDLRVSEKGVPYVLEVNTIPGLTERSLLPMAAGNVGLDFFQLCVKMIVASINGI